MLIIYHKQRSCDTKCPFLCVCNKVHIKILVHLHVCVCVHLCHIYLRPQVEITVHREYRVCVVLCTEWKQLLAGVLEVFFQEELSWSSQEKVLAVWGTDVLRGPH